jgi:hypothetical protein
MAGGEGGTFLILPQYRGLSASFAELMGHDCRDGQNQWQAKSGRAKE